MPERHPTASHWQFPPEQRPPLGDGLRRANLRELAARPDRFEHHLMVLGRIGVAQIEVAVASEPLYFAHRNISDEYVVPMTSGDPMADAMSLRTFLSDFDTDEIVARYKHGTDQLLLHPYGYLHWPGKLRPPFKVFEFAPGMRRTAFSLVCCSFAPAPPEDRPLFASAGLEADTKRYASADVPMLLADLHTEPARVVGVVGTTTITLLAKPVRIAPPRGGYAVVLSGTGDYFPGDLVYIPPGRAAPAEGIDRALVFAAPLAPEPPPPSWDAPPPPPFAVYEDAEPGALPVAVADMTVAAVSDELVSIRIGGVAAVDVPRYWLARMMFRLALHQYTLGYLESYGGFFYDDSDGQYRLGLRGVGAVSLARDEIAAAVETLYRAVAPTGYVERLV